MHNTKQKRQDILTCTIVHIDLLHFTPRRGKGGEEKEELRKGGIKLKTQWCLLLLLWYAP